MQELEQKFINILEYEVLKNQEFVCDVLGYDDIAKEEFKKLIRDEHLVKEVFVNTYKIHMQDDELNEYLRLRIELQNVANKLSDMMEKYEEIFHDKTQNIVESFYEHNQQLLLKLTQDSIERESKVTKGG